MREFNVSILISSWDRDPTKWTCLTLVKRLVEPTRTSVVIGPGRWDAVLRMCLVGDVPIIGDLVVWQHHRCIRDGWVGFAPRHIGIIINSDEHFVLHLTDTGPEVFRPNWPWELAASASAFVVRPVYI